MDTLTSELALLDNRENLLPLSGQNLINSLLKVNREDKLLVVYRIKAEIEKEGRFSLNKNNGLLIY